MSSSTDPLKKQPASYREPVLEKLVLNDLIQLSNDSRYDKNVLLWMQDRYVNQAITENMTVLIDLVRKGKQEGSTPDEMKRERIETLVRLARETYSSEKSLGRGADLKTYLDAATTETPPRAWGRLIRPVSGLGAPGNTPTGVGKTQ